MKVNIKKAISTIGNVEYYQPLYEAIINSFQANAHNITITFKVLDNHVIGYSIKDDGEGFTNENIESFLELWSEYNIKKGALGSGRILCLKVFDNILISSQTKNSDDKLGQKVDIDFNRNFEANTIEDINHSVSDSNKSFTLTEFKNINNDYRLSYDKNKNVFDLEEQKNDIFIKLLPMFINFHNENKEFSITINKEKWLDKDNLKSQFKEQEFKQKSFLIEKDLSVYNTGNEDLDNNKKFKFTLFYRIVQDNNSKIEQFYGASGRFITSFTKGAELYSLPEKNSGIFCLTSSYFDERVKDSRNKFNINENNPSKESPIKFMEIKEKLGEILDAILVNQFSDIKSEFAHKQREAREEFPHLSKYIEKIKNITTSKKDIIKQSEKAFILKSQEARDKTKEFTSKLQEGKTKFNEEEYQKITKLFTLAGKEQLAAYISYRQTIIEMLIAINIGTDKNKKEFNEGDIHDLFYPRKHTSSTSFHYANNIWIFDDKFMSYNYSASDITISKIVNEVDKKDSQNIPKHHKDKKPDLVMFYSDSEDKWKDVLLIEFKRLKCTIDEKETAINQLNRYPRYIKNNVQNIRSIFTYTILDIDDEFRESLADNSFIKNAFGDIDDNTSAYYKYNPNSNAHINVVSFEQIIQDADKRNKVFLDILVQNFKS